MIRQYTKKTPVSTIGIINDEYEHSPSPKLPPVFAKAAADKTADKTADLMATVDKTEDKGIPLAAALQIYLDLRVK